MKYRRKSLTRKQRDEMIAAQHYKCFTPDCFGEPKVAEHWTCVAMGNEEPPDCMLCVECAIAKTKRDLRNLAKMKRLRDHKTQADKRAKRGSQLRSRGFDKSYRKHIDGTVTRVEPKRWN